MRKLTPTQGTILAVSSYLTKSNGFLLLMIGLFSICSLGASAQCTTESGKITGTIYQELNDNGEKDGAENGLGNVMVTAYDASNELVAQGISNSSGLFELATLENGTPYRLEFTAPTGLQSAAVGNHNASSIQFVTAPACDIHYAVVDSSSKCGDSPEIVLSCFVEGRVDQNGPYETIIGLEHDFTNSSAVKKYATHAETGAVWGMAYSESQSAIYSAAFVKQNAGLTQHGIGAIYKTSINGTPSTSLFVDLEEMLVDVGTLAITDITSCDYGSQVGKYGLGGLVMSDDQQTLYVVNIYNNSIVAIPTSNPNPGDTRQFSIPDPGCTDGDTRAFALHERNGVLYVGVTCTAETSQNADNSSIHVYEFTPSDQEFTLVFSTEYAKGYWFNEPADSEETQHWLTDIDFTDEGHMLLALSDRIGHRYCNGGNNRLDQQHPDLLVAYLDNGNWTLESNGVAGTYIGSGVNNGQGPDGGEFFGHDYWPSGPLYHSETSLGSVFVFEGKGEVVSANYDPSFASYSGGLHRYNTTNGRKVNFKELYNNTYNLQFGKATGFGDIISVCSSYDVEIGNFVWYDDNANGVQDAGEAPISDLAINLLDANCNVIGTTTTDNNGNYIFNRSNVDLNGDNVLDPIDPTSNYYLQVGQTDFDPTTLSYLIDGVNYTFCTSDLGYGQYADANDSDIIYYNGICSALDESHGIPVLSTTLTSNNHTFDIGLCRQDFTMDLALMKTVVGQPFAKFGNQVQFKIAVINQGQQLAQTVDLVDYIPEGLKFVETGINDPWILDGDVARIQIENLNVGETRDVYITFEVAAGNFNYLNFAEISSFTDYLGEIGVDEDSTPDSTNNNDNGGEVNSSTDDVVDDGGSIDEDDHDPAMLYKFDLALRKVLDDASKIYLPGEDAAFTITVYNQGDVDAEEVQIVEYLPSDLLFEDSKNDGWYFDVDGNLVYDIVDVIPAGASKTIHFVGTIADAASASDLINVSEISSARAVGFPNATDFDSTPDSDESNDIGGDVNTATDNEISDPGLVDEDDSDPATVRLEVFDLALLKTVNVEYTKKGDYVDFNITIVNQGSIIANNILVTDYLPVHLSLADSDWQLTTSTPKEVAEYLVTIPGGLAPGGEHTITITTRVDPDAPATYFVNIAEISYAEDLDGNDRSLNDMDSTPDSDPDNDLGGIPGAPESDNTINADASIDEDDHDPAFMLLASSEFLESCICQNNATTPINGLFNDILGVTSGSGETWYIQNVIGFYDPTSTADNLIDFITGPSGVTMMENPLGNGMSLYYLEGSHVDGLGHSIMMTNGRGAFETLDNAGCSYDNPVIDGPPAACASSTLTYSTDVIPSATYEWIFDGSTVGTEATVDITMASVVSTQTLELIVTAPGACYAPSILDIQVGETSSSIACVGSINVSLAEDCELVITPNMIMVSDPVDGAAYGVMLTDPQGNVLPNATITRDYLGIPITAKVIDPCSGNSCWSIVMPEDKLGPEIFCQDITVNCIDMLTYDGPLAVDNCDTQVGVTLLSELITPLDCDPLYIKRIDRTYIAEDDLGNESSVCAQEIMVARIDLINEVEDFTGIFELANWTPVYEGDGIIDVSSAPTSVTLSSANSGGAIAGFGTEICMTMITPTRISFDWDYHSDNSNVFWDNFGYKRNGFYNTLTDDFGPLDQSGSQMVYLQAGEVFCFVQESLDACCGRGITTISNFNAEVSNIDPLPQFMVSNDTNLDCGMYPINAQGTPDVSHTGVPTVDGVPLFPDHSFYCNISVGYDDNIISVDDCVSKVMRTWNIVEWYCGDAIVTQIVQALEIQDDNAPTITSCPDDILTTTNGNTCDATIDIGIPTAEDLCSPNDIRIDVAYPGGFESDFTGGSINLTTGDHVITYTVYDLCGNSSSCSFNVTVEDHTNPIAICDQFTTVGLGHSGIATVYASAFDDGSYDECHLDRMEVLRMDDAFACASAGDFSESVNFCCEDVGNTIQVVFRIWDIQGNMNQCMVNVEVQDKFAPVLTVPDDTTYECGLDFDINDLSQFGIATATDACEVEIIETPVALLSSCGTGQIIRTFTASDANGSTSGTQTIIIYNPTPFDGNITWPLDYESEFSCTGEDLSPEQLPFENGFPQFTEDNCDMISATYVDDTYLIEPVNNACFKILRRWTVIDWCNNNMTWTWDQIIKVRNFEAPVITSSCEDIEVCTFDPSCLDGFVPLVLTAMDVCTPDEMLEWNYVIDLDTDGINDVVDSGVGATIDLSAEYPLGSHSVIWSVEDKCGNFTSCSQLFTVINCTPPIAYCLDNVAVALQPMDLDGDGELDAEMAEICVEHIDNNSSHSCGYPVDLSFSADVNDDCIVYDCDSLGIRNICLWVTDINGNTAVCKTTVDVQDNNDEDVCDNLLPCITHVDAITSNTCGSDYSPAIVGGTPIVATDCACTNFTTTFTDALESYPNVGCVVVNRTWTITFNCGSINPIVLQQTISVENAINPTINCPSDITVDIPTGGNCEAFVSIASPTLGVNAFCNTGIVITNNSPFATSTTDASGTYPAGTTTVTFTATDDCGNIGTCSMLVVVQDVTGPICSLMDITVNADASGPTVITFADLDNGSFDACSNIDPMSITITPSSFDCATIGAQTVTVTMSDTAGNPTTCTAQVTVMDVSMPVCNAQNAIVLLDANGMGSITADAIDDGSTVGCTGTFTLSVSPNTFTCADLGPNVVTLTVLSSNGSSSSCTAIVDVQDVTGPICSLMDITVNADASGPTVITFADIDDGSFDDCTSIDPMSITITPRSFDCSTIGAQTVTVTMSDLAGNSTTCTATVTVMDVTMPICSAQDATVFLDGNGMASITADQIDNGSTVGCTGSISLTVSPNTFTCDDMGPNLVVLAVMSSNGSAASCSAIVNVLDITPPSLINCPSDITLSCDQVPTDLDILGVANGIDNCDGNIAAEQIVVMNVNTCNIGTIVRTFIATDSQMNTSQCSQVITVTDMGSVLMESDIVVEPDTIFVMDCTSIDPDSIGGTPIIGSTGAMCFNVSINYVDSGSNMTCMDTINRTWTVIDSCQLNGDGVTGIFDFDQVVVVDDSMAPIITLPDSITQDCAMQPITVIATVTDCDPNVVVTNTFNTGGADATDTYPVGSTDVTFTATDACGNLSTALVVVTALDTIPPVVDCKKLFPVIVSSNQPVTISPLDFLCAFSDNCSDSLDATYLFMDFWEEGIPFGSTTTFSTFDVDCGDLNDPTPVYIAVLDEFGNFTPCISLYTVIDTLGLCPTSLVGINGNVLTDGQQTVANVSISLTNSGMQDYYTLEDGKYAFPDMPMGGSYVVEPARNDDARNGVSTLDLILIQKYILGLQDLTSPYQYIAADINKSGNISSIDLIELRKLILGIYDDFPHNESWRMVDAGYQFIDPTNPLLEAFPESYAIENINSNMTIDFVGVKIGDINGSVTANAGGNSTESRNADEVVLTYLDVEMLTGESTVISLALNNIDNLVGLQLSLSHKGLQIVSVTSDLLDLSGNNVFYNTGSQFTVSWNGLMNANQEAALLEIEVLATENIKLSESLSLDQSIVNAESYFGTNLEIASIDLQPRSSEKSILVVEQNRPNPWNNLTAIPYRVSTDGEVSLLISNAVGKTVYRTTTIAKAGWNEFIVSNEMLTEAGIYFYQISDGRNKSIKKMFVTE